MLRKAIQLSAAVGLCAGATFGQSSQVGDTPSYDFRDAILNGLGTGSLEEMRGKPLLVEFWGTR